MVDRKYIAAPLTHLTIDTICPSYMDPNFDLSAERKKAEERSTRTWPKAPRKYRNLFSGELELDLCDRSCGIQALGTCASAWEADVNGERADRAVREKWGKELTVEDSVAAVHAHLILEQVLALSAVSVLRVPRECHRFPRTNHSTEMRRRTLESAIHLYACMSVAGPRYSSWFHQYEGHDVEQHAQRMHSYNPSSLLRSSGLWRNSPCVGGLSFCK